MIIIGIQKSQHAYNISYPASVRAFTCGGYIYYVRAHLHITYIYIYYYMIV